LEAAVVDGGHRSVKKAGNILVKHCSKQRILLRSPASKLVGIKKSWNLSLSSLDADSPGCATKLLGQLIVGHGAEKL
jgi:hypothetical protein